MSFADIWDRLRASLWFVPALVVGACSVLAIALVEVEGAIPDDALRTFPRLFGAGADGTRGMLEAIAGAMITVAGVTFSITIVALSLTSSQYSSRVLRNFMSDRTNQFVLGTFVGAHVYCLIVLRTIRGGTDGFVPSIATLGALVLAFVGIALLIHFIHHISSSIQAARILAAIDDETSRAIERIYPEPIGNEGEEPLDSAMRAIEAMPWANVASPATGYVQSVDADALLRVACERDLVVRLECAIGDFVIASRPLGHISPPALAPAAGDALRKSVRIGVQRTPRQDAAFGFRQIVDIALKALSPGVNDPTTAAMCIDRLAGLLVRLAARRIPPSYRYVDGRLRVIAPRDGFEAFLLLAFEEVRVASLQQPAVLTRLIHALTLVGEAASNPARVGVVASEMSRIQRAVSAIADEETRSRISPAIAFAVRRLDRLVAATPGGPSESPVRDAPIKDERIS